MGGLEEGLLAVLSPTYSLILPRSNFYWRLENKLPDIEEPTFDAVENLSTPTKAQKIYRANHSGFEHGGGGGARQGRPGEPRHLQLAGEREGRRGIETVAIV